MSIMIGGIPPFSFKRNDSAWPRRAASVAGLVAFRGFTSAQSPAQPWWHEKARRVGGTGGQVMASLGF